MVTFLTPQSLDLDPEIKDGDAETRGENLPANLRKSSSLDTWRSLVDCFLYTCLILSLGNPLVLLIFFFYIFCSIFFSFLFCPSAFLVKQSRARQPCARFHIHEITIFMHSPLGYTPAQSILLWALFPYNMFVARMWNQL